jgi:hypothetical protein
MEVRLERVTVTTTYPWRLPLTIAAMLALPLLGTLALGFPQGTIMGIPLAFLFPSLTYVQFPGQYRLAVRTDADGLHVGERLVTCDDIDDVVVDPYAPLLRIELPGKTMTLDVPRDAAERIHELLTRRPAHPRARRTFTVTSAFLVGRARAVVGQGAAVIVTLAAAMVLAWRTVPLAGLLSGLGALVASTWVARRLVRRTQVTVGGDGVLLRNGARTRFVPVSEISAIEAPARITVGDETIELRAKRRERPALRRTLTGLLERAKGTPVDGVVERSVLAGSSPDQWIDAVRRERSEPSYRAAAVDDTVRWRLAEDVTATAEQRAAAAIALGDSRQARHRVQRIAKGVAAPELRAILEAVAEEDEAGLVESVAKLRRRS